MSNKAERINKRAIKHHALDVISYLDISDGDIIADIGSGGGLLAFEFAKRTKSGFVVAADTDASLLEYIEGSKAKQGIRNVVTINIQEVERLHQYQYDLIFMRNVYHHIDNPVTYFSGIRSCLKRNGRIAVIDWNEQASPFLRLTGHSTPKQQILEEMSAAGYCLKVDYPHLKGQSFAIFTF